MKILSRTLANLINQYLLSTGRKSIAISQTYESNRIAILNRNKVDVVIDVGANKGQYASMLRGSGFIGQIISVEPLPDAFAALYESFKSDAHWTGINAACGRAMGRSLINVTSDSVCSSLLSPTGFLLDAVPEARIVEQIEVDVVTIDDVMATIASASFTHAVKIDVQGFEREVLEGASETLRHAVVLEIELSLAATYENSETIYTLLPKITELGFELVSIGRGYSNPSTGQLLDGDFLFQRGSVAQIT